MFWVRSDLESRKKIRIFSFRGGGGQIWTLGRISFSGGGCVLGKIRFGLSGKNFIFRGGCSGTKSQNRGVLENLVKNFWKLSLLVHLR